MKTQTKAELRAEIDELHGMLSAANQVSDDLARCSDIYLDALGKALIALSHAAMREPALYQGYYDALRAAMLAARPEVK